jgi:DNA replication factor GINS
MDVNEINYKTLRKIQQIEEKNPILTKIDEFLYKKISEYIKNLKIRYKNEKNKQKKLILENEINNTNKIIKDIYEIREKKILNAIVTKVRGGKPNLINLVDAEKNLFDSIFELMILTRKQNIETKIIKENIINNTNIKTGGDEKITDIDNIKIMLVKENIPEFIGIDGRKYNLRKDDIITIPKNTSELLLKGKVVKELK